MILESLPSNLEHCGSMSRKNGAAEVQKEIQERASKGGSEGGFKGPFRGGCVGQVGDAEEKHIK